MKKLIRILMYVSLIMLGIYLFVGYVLVPHPDYIKYYIPSIIEYIESLQPEKV